MLELRPNCECCDKDLPPESTEAVICTFECTFCVDCAENSLSNICPNCGGNFTPRPLRPANLLKKYPASAKRILKGNNTIIKGTFTTQDFKPSPVKPIPHILTGLPTGISTMEKIYSGSISGHSTTIFLAAFDPEKGVGTYVAMESFEGKLDDRKGAFNFIHSAATKAKNRTNEFFTIVEGSGTEALTGIRGKGGIAIDEDGTHRIWFDLEGWD
jgi:hypothetical protein